MAEITINQFLVKIARGSFDASEFSENLPEALSENEKTEVAAFFHAFEFRKNNWHTSDVIDFLNDTGVFDTVLEEKALALLFEKERDYLVKLSVLDYLFWNMRSLNLERREDLEELVSGNSRLIVRNQVLLLLMSYRVADEKLMWYKNCLLRQLRNTTDYRAHIRLYNTMMYDFDRFDCLETAYLEELLSVSGRMEARSVKGTIAKFRLFIAANSLKTKGK